MHKLVPAVLMGLATTFAQNQPALLPAGGPTNAPAAPAATRQLPPGTLTNALPASPRANETAAALVTNGVLVAANNVPPTSILGTNIVVRPITLQQAVEMALQNNYAIQISRYNPDIADYNLRASYGVYDPALQFGATHSFNTSPGGLDQQGIVLPSTEIEQDSFSGALGPGASGYAPSGLQYGISVDVSRREFMGGNGQSSEQFNSGLGVNLSQPLLRDFWIDQPRATIQINKKRLRGSEWLFRGDLLTTVAAVETAYYDLISARESIKVQQTALQYANQLLRENKKRVEVGALAPLDEKQAESEVARVVASLLQSEQIYALQENLLKNLVTQDFANWTNIVLDPVETLVALPASPSLAESWQRGLSMRPELMQLKYDLEAQDINLKYLKNQIWPALDLVGTWGQSGLEVLPNRSYERAIRSLGRDKNPRYSYGAILSFPIGNVRARNTYKANVAARKQSLLQYKELEQTIMMQIDNAIKLLQSQFQQVEASRQARLYAQDALAAEQKKYENGKSTSFLVLQAQRDLTQRRFEELSALPNYNKALSGLSSAEGTTLDRFSLNLNFE